MSEAQDCRRTQTIATMTDVRGVARARDDRDRLRIPPLLCVALASHDSDRIGHPRFSRSDRSLLARVAPLARSRKRQRRVRCTIDRNHRESEFSGPSGVASGGKPASGDLSAPRAARAVLGEDELRGPPMPDVRLSRERLAKRADTRVPTATAAGVHHWSIPGTDDAPRPSAAACEVVPDRGELRLGLSALAQAGQRAHSLPQPRELGADGRKPKSA